MKKQKSTKLTTNRQLAERIGVHPGQISRWTHDPSWKFGRAPWADSIIPAIARWRAEMLATEETNDADVDDLSGLKRERLKQDIRRLRAVAEVAETDLAERRRKLLNVAEVQFVMASTLANFRQTMMALPGRLAIETEGLDSAEREAVSDRHIRAALTEVSEGFAKLMK